MELGDIPELIVLVAIVVELVVLYNHTKFDKRIDEHITEADKNLSKSNGIMKILDDHTVKFDEHISTTDDHIQKLDEHIARIDEHIQKLYNHLQTSSTK